MKGIINQNQGLSKVVIEFLVILCTPMVLLAEDPEFYVKKDTWQDTILASRRKLQESRASTDEKQLKADKAKIWQLVQRDFDTNISISNEMLIEKRAEIWDEDWPAGDYAALAQRYVDSIKETMKYLTDFQVDDFDEQAQKLAERAKSADDLAGVRRLFYQADEEMKKLVLAEARENIAQYRMGTLVIQAKPGGTVKVTQLRHEFRFGSALDAMMWSVPADYQEVRDWGLDYSFYKDPNNIKLVEANREKYLQMVKENFNHASHRNCLKWFNTEAREKGDIYFTGADRVAEWCRENDITIRGHCILWGVESLTQEWLKKLDKEELRRQIRLRIYDVLNRYQGLIEEWDLNNELIGCRWYRDQLGEGILKDMYRWGRLADLNAVFFLNDGYIRTGQEMDKRVNQIRELFYQGYVVGGIGCQSHFARKAYNLAELRYGLSTLAQFHLPIRITEYIPDYDTSDEDYRAQMMSEFYTLCFGHPQVTGIVLFGFWEGAHWRPNYALWKLDWSPRPTAEVYRRLVFNDWWTNFAGKTNEDGVCRVPVFYGRHKVEVNGSALTVDFPQSQGKEKMLVVD